MRSDFKRRLCIFGNNVLSENHGRRETVRPRRCRTTVWHLTIAASNCCENDRTSESTHEALRLPRAWRRKFARIPIFSRWFGALCSGGWRDRIPRRPRSRNGSRSSTGPLRKRFFPRFLKTLKTAGDAVSQAPSPAYSPPRKGRRYSTPMKRSELEHVVRAASAITLHQEFVIMGSQAILGDGKCQGSCRPKKPYPVWPSCV